MSAATVNTSDNAEDAFTQLRGIVEDAITNHPRSLQRRIGPSEIGAPCDHCLAAKLAGWTKHEVGIPWLPTIGTAVHEWLELTVTRHEIARIKAATNPDTERNRFWCEERVNVGTVGGVDITGSCDLFHAPTGTVIDYKVVGTTTLRKARSSGPSATYRAQAHLYGRGWTRRGEHVNTVAIWFLPRNAASLDHGYLWSEPYDEQVALDALTRADQMANNVAALATAGEQVRDEWITNLPRDPACWDCRRYPDAPKGANHSRIDLPTR